MVANKRFEFLPQRYHDSVPAWCHARRGGFTRPRMNGRHRSARMFDPLKGKASLDRIGWCVLHRLAAHPAEHLAQLRRHFPIILNDARNPPILVRNLQECTPRDQVTICDLRGGQADHQSRQSLDVAVIFQDQSPGCGWVQIQTALCDAGPGLLELFTGSVAGLPCGRDQSIGRFCEPCSCHLWRTRNTRCCGGRDAAPR